MHNYDDAILLTNGEVLHLNLISINESIHISCLEEYPELSLEGYIAERTAKLSSKDILERVLYTIFGSMTEWGSDPYFQYKKIIFNGPATIVLWKDGTKTVVKCQNGETFDKEKGIALCFMKKALGNTSNFNNVIKKEIKEEIKDA